MLRQTQPAFHRSGRRGEPSSTIRCNLFFQQQLFGDNSSSSRKYGFSEDDLDELRQSSLTLPYSFPVAKNGNSNENDPVTLTIRKLEKPDLDVVVPMCAKEFGTSPTEVKSFPWDNLNKAAIDAWFDDLIFGPLVGIAFEAKIVQREKEPFSDFLLCLEQTTADGSDSLIGIVDLSMQPLDPSRNPPPFPFPMWYKQAYAASKELPGLDGWISNLLIDEKHRGKGYAKILMAAAEGLARSWGCSSLSLHVDADRERGKVPRKLYQTLGYTPVMKPMMATETTTAGDTQISSQNDYAWMGDRLRSGLYNVDGCMLVFMQKEL